MYYKKFIFTLFCILILCTSCFSFCYATSSYIWSDSKASQLLQTNNNSTDLKLESDGAILIEQSTGTVLYEHNAHEMFRPAKIKVKIPAGISEGQTVVLRGEGEPGIKGGSKGDLYINVHVKRHSIYKRKGDHVLCDIPITFTGATLGTEIEVPMVDGTKEKYKIPEGTQTGTQFVMRNKGFKSVNGNYRGDFVFTVNVQVPKKLTAEQRELIKKLALTMNEQPPIKKRGIFG